MFAVAENHFTGLTEDSDFNLDELITLICSGK